MPRHKLLVIEDDRSLVEVLKYNLEQAGYAVLVALDGQDGLNQARLQLPDLILLDVMIPVVDGIEVCKRLRANPDTAEIPVLMLTAKSEESAQLIGFSVGADDYVVKPFSVKILLQRIKALIRRKVLAHEGGTEMLVAGNIRIDRIKHRVTVGEIPVDFTPSAFRLLETLARQPGRAVDRNELIESALGDDTLVLERTIDVHIRSLRKKLGDSSKYIQTVRGIGYRFLEPETSGVS